MKAVKVALAVLIMAGGTLCVQAQEWPNRPVRVYIPVASGAGTDLVARVVAEEFQVNSGQPMVIENRPAGGGTQAADIIARSDPDGYNIILGNSGLVGILPHLLKRIPFDTFKDFTFITPAAETALCIVVKKDLPVSNAKELVEYAKANPGKLSFGSSGQGSGHHLAGVYFNSFAGVDMTHIAYRGGAPAMTDLLAGQIPVLVATVSTVTPYMNTDQLKIIGMVGAQRSKIYNQIPTIGEVLPGFAVPTGWLGYFGPPNIPKNLLDRIHGQLVKAITSQRVSAAFEKAGFETFTLPPDEFTARVRKEYDVYGKIIAEAKIERQ
ncbi:MAG TPA: tripartite tricarboxylate transporter substrate binding protein [Xanthobacteraceae bacterium]|nr:tripartite tricarboxylate transporter substrate binding protein [Xanthobacteraceae bacterium]